MKQMTIKGLMVVLWMAGASYGVIYTWTGAAGDGNWNNTANWDSNGLPVDSLADTETYGSGLSMSYAHSIVFDGTAMPTSNVPATGGNAVVGQDTPAMEFKRGGAISFAAGGRETSFWINTNVGVRNLFVVGDGVNGANELVDVTISGVKYLQRHTSGPTHHFVVKEDGTLNFTSPVGGILYFSYTAANRLATFEIAGGKVTVGGSLANFTTYSGNYIDFTAPGGSFTAKFGSNLADIAAVQAVVDGNDFIRNNAGVGISAVDNGDGTFTVSVEAAPHVGLFVIQ
jgi:hypothetical protein